jgi:hypothetical protein
MRRLFSLDTLNWLIRIAVTLILFFWALGLYLSLWDSAFRHPTHFWLPLILWLTTAYIVLPRLYRWLSKLFVPDYFIGRTRTSDNLLGDPVNIALIGSREQLVAAMKRAGWIEATPLSLHSSLAMVYNTLRGKSYPDAPVSNLFLFGNVQDIAFQKQVEGNPRKRHHVRFWKTPENWWLPGGYKVDWLGAATYDKHVGFSLFTGQITHKIDENVDSERDFIVQSLVTNKAIKKHHTVEHFMNSYRSRNGGGDHISTDGSLPFITL